MSLLDEVMAAHGGRDRWAQARSLRLKVRIGGHILALRFTSPATRTLTAIVDPTRPYISLEPFPREGVIGVLDGERLHLRRDNRILAERSIVRDDQGDVRRRAVWDDLDVLYFLGYALWNYAVTPFVFDRPGLTCQEGPPWREPTGDTWRTLLVTFPPGVPTHSREQTFYFDAVGLLRRLDYTADVFGNSARGAHYCEGHRTFDGLVFPTHRVVYARGRSGHPIRMLKAMEGWIDRAEIED